MGYNKVVISGNLVEVYEYEKNLSLFSQVRRKHESRVENSVLEIGGENALSQRQLGKRSDNARRATMAFSRLVRANLVGVERPVLFTFTYEENMQDLRQGYQDFHTFIKACRYKVGSDFRYIVVPEFQKRGAVHFHALFWGIPSELVLSERQTRFFARLWKRGFLFIKQTDGNERLSHYLSKYMTKAYLDPRLKFFKAYVASRNVLRSKVLSGVSPLYPVLDDYGLSTACPLREKKYLTQWLGQGRYRSYELN